LQDRFELVEVASKDISWAEHRKSVSYLK
jgi:hypothetical protein